LKIAIFYFVTLFPISLVGFLSIIVNTSPGKPGTVLMLVNTQTSRIEN